MPICHKLTARDLEQQAATLQNVADNNCHTWDEKKAVLAIKEHILGLSDWHRSHGPRAKKADALIERMTCLLGAYLAATIEAGNKPADYAQTARIVAAGERYLTPIDDLAMVPKPAKPDTNPMLGKSVKIIRGTYAGKDGTIESSNLNGTYNIRVNSVVSLKNQRPGIDINFNLPAATTA